MESVRTVLPRSPDRLPAGRRPADQHHLRRPDERKGHRRGCQRGLRAGFRRRGAARVCAVDRRRGGGRRPIRGLDPHRRSEHRLEFPGGHALGVDDAGRLRRGHADPHLRHRVHARGCALQERHRPLPPFLCLHEPVHRHDDDPGQRQLLPDAVRRLGRRGPVLVPADRFLVRHGYARAAFVRQLERGQEGFHHQPHRRFRFPDRRVYHVLVV